MTFVYNIVNYGMHLPHSYCRKHTLQVYLLLLYSQKHQKMINRLTVNKKDLSIRYTFKCVSTICYSISLTQSRDNMWHIPLESWDWEAASSLLLLVCEDYNIAMYTCQHNHDIKHVVTQHNQVHLALWLCNVVHPDIKHVVTQHNQVHLALWLVVHPDIKHVVTQHSQVHLALSLCNVVHPDIKHVVTQHNQVHLALWLCNVVHSDIKHVVTQHNQVYLALWLCNVVHPDIKHVVTQYNQVHLALWLVVHPGQLSLPSLWGR